MNRNSRQQQVLSLALIAGGLCASAARPQVVASLPGTEDLPIHFVTWMNAVRFANWLHAGQPDGDRSVRTTERGSYDLTRSCYDRLSL